jgi:hypothetical protein
LPNVVTRLERAAVPTEIPLSLRIGSDIDSDTLTLYDLVSVEDLALLLGR